jgi:hypothetical protein
METISYNKYLSWGLFYGAYNICIYAGPSDKQTEIYWYGVLEGSVRKEVNRSNYALILSRGIPRGVWGVQTPPPNSEVLTKLSRIPSSVENTSLTT